MFLTKESSSPFYQLIYFVDGKKRKISTRTSVKNDAELFLKNFPPCETKPAKKVVPAADIILNLSLFREEYLNYSRLQYSRLYVERSIKPAFKFFIQFAGDLPINLISPKIIDSFISVTQKRSLSAASLYYRTLKAAFSKAVLWNYLDENPFRKIKAPRLVKSFPVYITVEELNLIMLKESNPVLANIYLTAFYTGMRLGEILNMKWNWIDFNNNIITVKCYSGFTTKSKKDRIIPINPVLKNALQNISLAILNLDKNSFVFQKYFGIKLNEDFISKRFKKCVRAAKLNDKIHFHSLRHSFASNLAQKDVSLYVVKELLGHEDIKTTQIYSHLQKENLARAVNLL